MTSSWFLLSTLNYDARSTTHQIYVSIFPDSQAVLRAVKAAKTTSLLVQQCQKALNNISTRHSAGLFWVPRHSGICGNKTANGFTVHQFVGSEPAFGFLRQITRRKIKCWTDKYHVAMWQVLTSAQRQAHKLV